jgi:transcriptional regulator with XRE-family HTH domain
MKFKDVIHTERRARNLTQKDFARLLNVSDKTISKWETGISIPDLETLMVVSKVLGIPVIEKLLNDNDNNESDIYEKFSSNLINSFKTRQYLIISLFLILSTMSFLFREALYRLTLFYIPVITIVFFGAILATLLNLSRFYSQYSNIKGRQLCDSAYLITTFILIDFVTIVLLIIEVFIFYVPNFTGIAILTFLQIVPFLLHSMIMKKTKFHYKNDEMTKRMLVILKSVIVVDFLLQVLFQIGVNFFIPMQLLSYVVTILMFVPIGLLIIVSRRNTYVV